MSWLNRLLSSRPESAAAQAAVQTALAQWQALPPAPTRLPHYETRYVVLNTEATGLHPERDRLLSVAAIAIERCRLDPAHSLYAALEPAPAQTLARLLAFCGQTPVVVFNSGFNRVMLEQALSDTLNVSTEWPWLDLYWILPALFPEHQGHAARLTDWMGFLGIETFQRHHALGDAYAIAQLLLAALARARQRGLHAPQALAELESRTRRDSRPR